jgi:hypothetical protein
VRSEWLYYEAGVISGKGPNVRICPYLVCVDPAALSNGPLGQYQCTEATKDDTLRLVRTLNSALRENAHHPELVVGNFESKWAELETALGVQGGAAVLVAGTGFVLSDDARELLVEAVKDKNGRVCHNRTRAGLTIATNNRNFVEAGNPRSEAQWQQALEELVSNKLLESLGLKNEVFQVTKRGYDKAESLQPKQSEAVPIFGLSNRDIISLLEEYLGRHKSQLGDKAFRFTEIDKAVGLPDGASARWLAEAANKFGYVVARKGDQTMTFRSNFTTVPTVVN